MAGDGSTTLSERKRQAIQAAGKDAFLRLGYEATSMDLIASAAGVAKQTVYSHFRNKETLFKAIIEESAAELVSPLRTAPDTPTDPVRVLTSFARQFVALMLEPSSLALYRLLVGEGSRFPELTREVYRTGPMHAVEMLAAYLTSQTRQGTLCVDQPELAAEQFLGMLTGLIQLRALFGIPHDHTPAELAIDRAVDSFLKAYAPG